MFIPRMWDHEVERIGKQRCTPIGYVLQLIGELIGFLGLLLILGVALSFAYRVVIGTFSWSLLWLVTVPVVMGILGSLLVAYSWSLANRKQFRYDHKLCVSSWIEGGQERTFTAAHLQAEQVRKTGKQGQSHTDSLADGTETTASPWLPQP